MAFVRWTVPIVARGVAESLTLSQANVSRVEMGLKRFTIEMGLKGLRGSAEAFERDRVAEGRADDAWGRDMLAEVTRKEMQVRWLRGNNEARERVAVGLAAALKEEVVELSGQLRQVRHGRKQRVWRAKKALSRTERELVHAGMPAQVVDFLMQNSVSLGQAKQMGQAGIQDELLRERGSTLSPFEVRKLEIALEGSLERDGSRLDGSPGLVGSLGRGCPLGRGGPELDGSRELEGSLEPDGSGLDGSPGLVGLSLIHI